jgi:hypothetical protein
MNPRIINLHTKGHNEKVKERDFWAHAWVGRYVLNAVAVAVEHNLHGKDAKSEYLEKTIMQETEEERKKKEKQNRPLTQEEIQKQTDRLFAQLRIMEANFRLNKAREKRGEKKDEETA